MGNSITLSMCSQVSFLILKSLIGIAWNSLCKQTLLFLRWCRGIPEASGFVGMGFMHFFCQNSPFVDTTQWHLQRFRVSQYQVPFCQMLSNGWPGVPCLCFESSTIETLGKWAYDRACEQTLFQHSFLGVASFGM